MRLHTLLLSTASLTVLCLSSARAESLNSVGDLPGGGVSTGAYGISNDGTTAVGDLSSASGFQAFRWTSGSGIVGLGDLAGGGFLSAANAVSGDGSVITGYSNGASGFEAFRWTSGTGMVGLGDLAGGIFYSYGYEISGDGTTIVGESSSGPGVQAFRWTSGTGMVGLGDLAGGAFYSFAAGVNEDGSVIVGTSTSGSGNEAFRWTSGTGMVGLGDLAGGIFGSQANAINNDGSVVVGQSNSASGMEAFRWTSGTGMVGLGDLPGGAFGSYAFGVNDDGSVIVGVGTDASGTVAIVWQNGIGMQSLADILTAGGVDLTGWVLQSANDVDDSGMIVVGGGTLGGSNAGFIANLASASITTPDALISALAQSTVPSQQAQAAMNTGMNQSLFAATTSLSALDAQIIDTSNPDAIAPAAGETDRLWSAYAVGSFGLGQNNDTDNHHLNGTTGIAVQMTDHLALGLGVIANTGHEQLAFDGRSNLKVLGGSLLTAYEAPAGFRLYGTAFAARLNVETDRHYQNGAGIDGSQGETDGTGYGAAFRAGWEFPVSSQTSWMPYAEVSATRTHLDGYTETEGGFPAIFGDQTSTEVTSRLGAQVSHQLTPTLNIGGRAAWAHRIKEGDSGLSATSTGFSGTLSNGTGDGDWGEATATTNWQITPLTTFSAELSGRSGRTQEPMGTLTIGLKVGF